MPVCKFYAQVYANRVPFLGLAFNGGNCLFYRHFFDFTGLDGAG